MIKHYEGYLGTFDYDDEEFEIYGYIRYIGKGLSVDLPKGCINTSYMFMGSILPEGFHLGDFDTSNVRYMDGMFAKCILPEGFTLGDKFDTSNVKDISNMFYECKIPKGFSLGDKFNTSKVEDMYGMFSHCAFPEGMSEKSLLSKQKCLNNVYKTTLEKPYANVSCFTMDCLNDNIILLPENIFNGDKPSEVKIIRYPAIGNYSLYKLKAEYILESNSNKCCISLKSYVSLGLDNFGDIVCILK